MIKITQKSWFIWNSHLQKYITHCTLSPVITNTWHAGRWEANEYNSSIWWRFNYLRITVLFLFVCLIVKHKPQIIYIHIKRSICRNTKIGNDIK